MVKRSSPLRRNFKTDTPATYIARLFGTGSNNPAESLEYLFDAQDWGNLRDDPELPAVIASVKDAEANLRTLRRRLEALQNEANTRRCEHCNEPIYARSNARYCSTKCRVAAHRTRTATTTN